MYTIETDEGNTIYVGESQNENEELIRTSDSGWIWFHADKLPSGHAVINTDSPTKQEIYQAANLVKERCKLKHVRKGTVLYCPIKNLKPTGVPGEVELKRCGKTVVV
jgi:predicted ribosome quality control (RQC) complex YloA/Tae2 family protein